MIRSATTRTTGSKKAMALGLLVVVLVTIVCLLFAKPAQAKTFTVNFKLDTTDDLPGDGLCNAGFGLCPLRGAIQEANAFPGADTINFDIPGSGVHTIQPTSQLPLIHGKVTIDGYTQPGSKPNTLASGNNAALKIQLDGTNAGDSSRGLSLVFGNGSVIRGLVINRFGSDGVHIFGATNTKIAGNFIGTDATGAQDLGNDSRGVFVAGDSNTVGGTTPAARNLISGNDNYGIFLFADGNTVQGNYIGTDATGKGELGNGVHGVNIFDSSHNTVGGNEAETANVIAFNGKDGVSVASGVGNRILRNSIDDNAVIGIDLVGGSESVSGTTSNDPGDADAGPNKLQNKPVVISATRSGGKIIIKGKLNSRPSKTYVIRFFSNPPGFPPEGERYIGQKKVTTNAGGNVTFTFSTAQKVSNGRSITATATDPNGNTSEFGVGPACCS